MNGEFSSLPEDLRAPIDSAHKRLGPSMSILVLFKVLRQTEGLLAVRADMLLCGQVAEDVTLERKLG